MSTASSPQREWWWWPTFPFHGDCHSLSAQANERQLNMPQPNGLQPASRSKARRGTHPLTNIPSLPLTFPTLQAITLRVTTPMVQALSLLATTHTLRAPSLRALSRQAPTLLPAPTPTFQPPTTLQCTLCLVVLVRSIRPYHYHIGRMPHHHGSHMHTTLLNHQHNNLGPQGR